MCRKKCVVAGLAAGVVILVVSQVVDFLVTMAFPGYSVLDLGGMRAVTDPIMMLFFLHPFVLGLALAFLYPYLNLKGGPMAKGKKFGLMMWLVIVIPSAFMVFASMDYPLPFTVSQVVGGLLYMLAAGVVIAKLMK